MSPGKALSGGTSDRLLQSIQVCANVSARDREAWQELRTLWMFLYSCNRPSEGSFLGLRTAGGRLWRYCMYKPNNAPSHTDHLRILLSVELVIHPMYGRWSLASRDSALAIVAGAIVSGFSDSRKPIVTELRHSRVI